MTALSLGSAPISRIAQKANIHRVTAHDSIKSLVTQGFFIEEKKGKTSFYQPLHPDLLLQKQQERMTMLEQILPQLRDLVTHDPITPRVQFIQGMHSCKLACRQLLESTKVLDCFLGSPIKSEEMLAFIDGEFEKKRVKARIKQRIVSTSASIQFPERIIQKKRLREKILIPKGLLTIQCGVYLYAKNKIMYNFFSNEEMSAVIIESKQLADTRRSLFTYFRGLTK